MHTHLCGEEGELEVALQCYEELIVAGHEVTHKVFVHYDPVTATVQDNVLWRRAGGNTPHVVVTLDKRAVQSLLLGEPSGRGEVVW